MSTRETDEVCERDLLGADGGIRVPSGIAIETFGGLGNLVSSIKTPAGILEC